MTTLPEFAEASALCNEHSVRRISRRPLRICSAAGSRFSARRVWSRFATAFGGRVRFDLEAA
jgi:hypothetical protein